MRPRKLSDLRILVLKSPEEVIAFFVRFIHYPPQKSSGKVTAQAHPDQSGFTLHLFESDPGLECLTYKTSGL